VKSLSLICSLLHER